MASGEADLHLTGQCRGGGLGPQAQQGFPAVVGVTALVAAASTALCMHIGVAGPATLAMLGSAVAIGALSGLAAAALGRLIEAAPDGS